MYLQVQQKSELINTQPEVSDIPSSGGLVALVDSAELRDVHTQQIQPIPRRVPWHLYFLREKVALFEQKQSGIINEKVRTIQT